MKRSITFVEDVVVRDHDGEVEQAYTAGKSYDLAIASAERWLRRGKAVEADVVEREATAKKAARKKKAAAPDDGDD